MGVGIKLTVLGEEQGSSRDNRLEIYFRKVLSILVFPGFFSSLTVDEVARPYNFFLRSQPRNSATKF